MHEIHEMLLGNLLQPSKTNDKWAPLISETNEQLKKERLLRHFKREFFEYLRFRKSTCYEKHHSHVSFWVKIFSVLSSFSVAIMGRLMLQCPGYAWTRWVSPLTQRSRLCGNTRPLWTRQKKCQSKTRVDMENHVISSLTLLKATSTVSDSEVISVRKYLHESPCGQAGINSHILQADCIFRRVSLRDMTNPSIRRWRRRPLLIV